MLQNLKRIFWEIIPVRIPLLFLGVVLAVLGTGKWALDTRVNLYVRGELIVSEADFRVRSDDKKYPVNLPVLTQTQLTKAELVEFSGLKVLNPAMRETVFDSIPRRTKFRFSTRDSDSLLCWIDAITLPDSGRVRVATGQEDALGLRLSFYCPRDQGNLSFNLHRDTEARMVYRDEKASRLVDLKKGASVIAVLQKRIQLRGIMDEPEPGLSVSDGVPVHKLSFERTEPDESAKSRSSIVSGRLEFDEDWLNPDRRGDAGQVPGFDLEKGDHLYVAAPDLTINDFEFVMVDSLLHIKLIFSGKANVLETRSKNQLKDGRLTYAEYFFLHPFWRLTYKLLFEVMGVLAAVLSLWWLFNENRSSKHTKDASGGRPILMRSIRRRLRSRMRRRLRK